MRYLGGKSRYSKQINEILKQYEPSNGMYFEPFLGGASVLQNTQTNWKRHASDINPYLITMWKGIQDGWIPPDSITEDEYRTVRLQKDVGSPLTAFVGFGCTFGGKWFGGYARNKKERNYCLMSKNSVLRTKPSLSGVELRCGSYNEVWEDLIKTPGSLVYCDPPYAGTTTYKGTQEFDSDVFWNWVRNLSYNHDVNVVVSEYAAPEDFVSVWSKEHIVQVKKNSDNSYDKTVEHLFVHESRLIK